MAAVIIEIADAVAAAIGTATLSQTPVVERVFVPVHELKTLSALTLSVVPTGLVTTQIDRTPRHQFDYTIDIGIQKRFPEDTLNQNNIKTFCDPLMIFAEEIVDLFRGRALTGYTAAKNTGAANQPIYSPRQIDEERVFTSVVTLTFSVVR